MNTRKGHRLPFNEEEHMPLVQNFIEAVENELNLPRNICYQKNRKREVVDVRKSIWMILYNHYEITTVRLAKFFNKEHCSVIYGIMTLQNLLKYDVALREKHSKILELSTIHLCVNDHLFFNNVPQFGWHPNTINEIQKS
jgi:chromosomal replication initiation ATPase DnaA